MIGIGTRTAFAFRCFFSLLFSGRIARDILDSVDPNGSASRATSPVAPPAAVAANNVGRVTAREDPGDRAVQLLALLQRDGRLVDFLEEDIAAYSDAQVGVAVRDVHANCREVLDKYLPVEPVLPDEEGARTTLGPAVDPASIRLIGNVTQSRASGTVRHRGWRIGRIALPPLPDASARLVIAPAEVEVE